MNSLKTDIRKCINTLNLSDVYTLLFFILFKLDGVSDYATLSELCYLLDGSNLTRLLTYFAGKTVKFPTTRELSIVTNALLIYNYVNVEGMSLAGAVDKLTDIPYSRRDDVVELYLKILPIMSQYNIDRSKVSKYDR